MEALTLSSTSLNMAGILLLAIVAVQSGGVFMLRIVRGRVAATPFQRAFARAGHAHAGVLVTLALVAQVFADAANMTGFVGAFARSGIAWAAILMPAGFFFSSAGKGRTEANRFIVLLWAGAAVLALGAVSLGIGLLTA
jgi:hypothetical protein